MRQRSRVCREDLLLLGRELDTPVNSSGEALIHYLAHSALRIRGRDGSSVPLIANRVQREFEKRRGQSNIVLKARQLGISTWIAARFFLKTALIPGTLTVQVAHTQQAAESLFQMVHRFYRQLPEDTLVPLRTARANVRQLVFPAIDSEYRVETAGDRNAGRGLTISNLHCTEVARWPGDAEEILQGMRAALSPRGELVLESTPMGAAGCFWNTWQSAAETGMVQHFFPWWMEQAYCADPVDETSLTAEEQALMEAHALSAEQIGYRRQIRTNYRELARQEYAETAHDCFLASGECYFDVTAIDRRLSQLEAPLKTRLVGRLQLWYPPEGQRRYIVAVDPAGGGSEGDYSVAQVIDEQTGLQCAELQMHCTALELAQEVAELAREYRQAMVAVERNNHGAAVIAFLQSVCGYRNLYRQGGQDGWLTTAISRPQMLAHLASALVETPGIFMSRRLLMECRSFVRQQNGRVEAQAGEHDDCVLAMAIALAVRAGH
jgi:hypothetical protein